MSSLPINAIQATNEHPTYEIHRSGSVGPDGRHFDWMRGRATVRRGGLHAGSRRLSLRGEAFRTKADRLSLVAAQHWDLAGAKAAGLTTVFVWRPGSVLNPLGPKPDIEVADVEEFGVGLLLDWRRHAV